MVSRVLITGASGFIGRSTVKYFLDKGFLVTALVRNSDSYFFDYHPNLQTVETDITNLKKLIKATKEVDAVVHLAALLSDEKSSFQVNVNGSKNLITASQENKIKKVIFISSASVKLKKRGEYAQTKLLAENLFLKSGLAVTIFRPSVVYTNTADEGGVFSKLVKAVQKSKVIPIFGSGQVAYYPIHVKDLNQAIFAALKSKNRGGKIYEVGGKEAITFKDLLIQIAQAYQKQIYIVHLPVWLGYFLAKILSLFFKKPPITLSNILGSTQAIDLDTEGFLKELSITPRSFKKNLKKIIRTPSNLEKEFGILTRYFLKRGWRKTLFEESEIENYQKALRINRLTVFPKDHWLYKNSFLIGSVDAISRLFYPYSRLSKKLSIVSALIECHPASATWLLPKRRSLINLMSVFFGLAFFISLKWLVGFGLLIWPGSYEKYYK
ncbi:NAD-dependent epimerase/dehydratase family protein [Candidatus Daviesbacteria bacterium]|nr:NAD-dependent epimerase/dehydratase family protein [Candidatus Daviesbacteria bacterium]